MFSSSPSAKFSSAALPLPAAAPAGPEASEDIPLAIPRRDPVRPEGLEVDLPAAAVEVGELAGPADPLLAAPLLLLPLATAASSALRSEKLSEERIRPEKFSTLNELLITCEKGSGRKRV